MKLLSFKSIGTKLLVLIIVSTTVLFSLVMLLVLNKHRDVLVKALESKADIVINLTQKISVAYYENFELSSMKKLVDVSIEDDEIVFAKYTNSAGKVFAYAGPKLDSTATSKYYIVTREIKNEDGEIVGKIEFGFSRSKLNAIVNKERIFVLSLTFLSILVLFFIAVSLSKEIVRPITVITGRLKDIAEGDRDLTQRLDVISNDEFATLAVRFNSFVEKLQDLLKKISTDTMQVDSLSNEQLNLANKIFSITNNMKNNVDSVVNSSKEASESVNSIAVNAGDVNSSVSSVASAIEEMNASLSEVSRNCRLEFESAEKAKNEGQKAQDVMNKLGDSANAIVKVVDVIKDIADQTNLLALNATIEAASAGEAGKGFAVVASEVKELAKQTADATNEIADLVNEVRDNSDLSIEAIATISVSIDEVNNISQTIVTSVEEQTTTINEISSNIASSSSNVESITANIQNVSSSVDETVSKVLAFSDDSTDAAEKSSAIQSNSNALSSLIVELNKLVGQFKL